ncbi:MAG: transglutaminase domain-containing protein [Leucobacter sp.]
MRRAEGASRMGGGVPASGAVPAAGGVPASGAAPAGGAAPTMPAVPPSAASPLSAVRQATRLVGGAVAAALALSLGVLAAWPIYQTAWLWLVAGVALVVGAGAAWARGRWRLSAPVLTAIVLGAFAVTVVPVAVPQALGSGFPGGLLDGLAAVALGWKQLLTLSLPVGTYRTVLVPVYVVMLVTALLIVLVAQRSPRVAALAAIPIFAPVAFGTVFGASQLSAPLRLGSLTIVAPREIALWLGAALLAAAWVVWTSGADRRAALRLGRVAGASGRRGGTVRGLVGAGIVVVALAAGAVIAPALDAGARAVPRDRIDPVIVVRDRPSPLADYRSWKRDDAIDLTLFRVSGESGLPGRLRLAVLDAYDGVDFHVSADAAGRFTRFPSGDSVAQPSRVTVEVGEGYADIWTPIARLGQPPRFTGERANELSDAFYVNRETGAAINVAAGRDSGDGGGDGAAAQASAAESFGLVAGDGYVAEMETAADATPDRLGAPASASPLFDADAAPELAAWIERQGQPADADGLAELIDRLRGRGYLSHSMQERAGEQLWLERLGEQYGTRFESSPGGHSLARLEVLFGQLNAQQAAAGEKPKAAQLVAGIGDDEQFAAAAALVARALGYDSRVVVGVRLGGEDRGVPGVPACAGDCTGEHLAAWIEVRGDRGEWVPVDVTPQVELRPERLEEGEQLPEFPTTPEERDAREVDPPVGLGDQGESSEEQQEAVAAAWLGPLLRAVGLSLAALLLLALPLLFLPVAKRLRARRRRAERVSELSALGAWEEMLDRARDAGVETPPNAARSEIAAVLGTKPALWAAPQVDRAVFSPQGIGQTEVEQLWQAAAADRAERTAGMGFFARVRAAYSLRSYGVGMRRRRPAFPESEQA